LNGLISKLLGEANFSQGGHQSKKKEDVKATLSCPKLVELSAN